MSNPKTQKPSTPDSLTKSGKSGSIELAENDLDKVGGGTNKAKSAEKAFNAMDGYIRG